MDKCFVGNHLEVNKGCISNDSLSREVWNMMKKTIKTLVDDLENCEISQYNDSEYCYICMKDSNDEGYIYSSIENFMNDNYNLLYDSKNKCHSTNTTIFVEVNKNFIIVKGMEELKNLLYILCYIKYKEECEYALGIDASLEEMYEHAMYTLITEHADILDDFLSIMANVSKETSSDKVKKRHRKTTKIK